jgi:hypothetical protein
LLGQVSAGERGRVRAVGLRERALLGQAKPEKEKSARAAILFFFFKI